MDSSANLFKQSLDKAYASPGMTLNTSTMGDASKYKQSFKEEDVDGESSKSDKPKKYLDIHDMIPELRRQLNKGTRFDPKHKKAKSKEESTEATGSGSSGGYSAPLFSGEEPNMGELSKLETKENKRGRVSPIGFSDEFMKKSNSEKKRIQTESNGCWSGYKRNGSKIKNGKKVPNCIKEQVEKVEATEATGSGSSGGYESPAMWAKSTKKKDWGPSRKTQIPGGGFVKIKKKCTKFPYCNQGDINNVKISKNESVKEAIKQVSSKMGVSENIIITILEHEYEKLNKRNN
jgi:hypothetical protein